MAAELTLEQRKAIAITKARMRMQQATSQANPDEVLPAPTPNIGRKGDMRPGDIVPKDVTGQAFRGITLGYGDELVAGMKTPVDMGVNAIFGGPTDPGEVYQQNRAFQNAQEARTREENPVSSMAAEITGALAMPTQVAGKIIQGGNLATKVAKGAGVGAAYGGLSGFGSGESLEDRTQKAKTGAAIGAGIGATIPTLGRVVGRVVGGRAAEAPSIDAIRRSAKQAYKQADESGLVVSGPAYSNAVQDVLESSRLAGLDYRIHPKAARALERLVEIEGGPVSLRELETLRRVVQGVAKSVEPDERRLAGLITDRLDKFMLGLKPGDMIAGEGGAINALFNARTQWSKLKKAETVENLMERARTSAAQFSGSGLENAIRTEFRALAKNQKLMRTFTAEEQKAIKHVARGGPVENAMRMLGKFAPTGVVSSALSGGTGLALGGPAGAVFLPAAGFLARQGATQMTKGNVRALDELIRRGGPALVNPKSDIAQKATEAILLGQTGLAGELLSAPSARPERQLPRLSGDRWAAQQ